MNSYPQIDSFVVKVVEVGWLDFKRMVMMSMTSSNLNTDSLHHMKLSSAVEVQNGLKLAR